MWPSDATLTLRYTSAALSGTHFCSEFTRPTYLLSEQCWLHVTSFVNGTGERRETYAAIEGQLSNSRDEMDSDGVSWSFILLIQAI